MKTRILSLALVLILAVTFFAMPPVASPASAAYNWTLMKTGAPGFMNGIWGTSPNDVFVTGGIANAVMHYNGSTWTQQTATAIPPTTGIWGSSGANVWIAGGNTGSGSIWHYDGAAWSSQHSASEKLIGIWGSSATNVFAVGEHGQLCRFDGTAWTNSTIDGGASNLRSVWGSSATNVFAAGNNGSIYNFDGTTWTKMTTPDAWAFLTSVWGSSASDVWAAGDGTIWHYNGTSWSNSTPASFTHVIMGLWGTSGSDIFAAGYRSPGLVEGLIWHYNGSSWSEVGGGTGFYQLMSVWGSGGYVYAGGNVGQIWRSMPVETITPTAVETGPIAPFVTTGSSGGFSSNTGGPPGQSPVNLASIQVQSATLSVNKVSPGQAVTVNATVANKGTGNGATAIKLYVNGIEESSKGVTVSSGSSTPVSFNVSRNEPGAYTVYVGGVSAGSFTVDQFADSSIILYISGALLLVALIGGLIYFTRRRTNS